MFFLTSFKITVFQVFILIGPGLLIGFLMNFVSGEVEKRAFGLMGRRIYLWFFGWLGTAVHELGHALMCVLFGHKINKLVLFYPDPVSQSLGYVEHSHNPRNIYHVIGNFFIGIGPILLGTVVIYVAASLLLTENFLYHFQNLRINHELLSSTNNLQEFAMDTYYAAHGFLADTLSMDSLKRWQLYVFCYLLFSVGSSIKLSPSDIKGALSGFTVMVGLLFLTNLTLSFFELEGLLDAIASLAAYFSVFYAMMLFALLLNLAILVSMMLITGIMGFRT